MKKVIRDPKSRERLQLKVIRVKSGLKAGGKRIGGTFLYLPGKRWM